MQYATWHLLISHSHIVRLPSSRSCSRRNYSKTAKGFSTAVTPSPRSWPTSIPPTSTFSHHNHNLAPSTTKSSHFPRCWSVHLRLVVNPASCQAHCNKPYLSLSFRFIFWLRILCIRNAAPPAGSVYPRSLAPSRSGRPGGA